MTKGSAEAMADLIWSEIAASGLSQATVAALAGVTPKHLSGVVGGRNGMSLDLIDLVLAQLGRELVLSTRVLVEEQP
jgi:transcriptional regulator with XRE-family HTH domain